MPVSTAPGSAVSMTVSAPAVSRFIIAAALTASKPLAASASASGPDRDAILISQDYGLFSSLDDRRIKIQLTVNFRHHTSYFDRLAAIKGIFLILPEPPRASMEYIFLAVGLYSY
jgi:hypothetical protein